MKTIILSFLTILVPSNCSTSDNKDAFVTQLPPITQTGANTFGAIINGQVMIPRNSIGYVAPGSNHYAVGYDVSNGDALINAADLRDTHSGSFAIYIKNASPDISLPTGDYPIFNG